jgi:chromosome segregation ATPase
MTVSNEQIQAALNAHENRFVVNEAAIAHHDATFAEIRRNLDYASQVLAQVAIGQEENRQQIAANQSQIAANQSQIAANQSQIAAHQEQLAILSASITELRNTVADMVRREGGTPSV